MERSKFTEEQIAFALKPADWLVPIIEKYPSLEKQYKKLKPKKLHYNEGKERVLTPVRTAWLGREDLNLRSRDQNPLPYRLATPQ